MSRQAFICFTLHIDLDDEFLSLLKEDSHATCLYRLLDLVDADLMYDIVDEFMVYYVPEENLFNINGIKLAITLEDVLYITGLPITGTVVGRNSRDHGAFYRALKIDPKNLSRKDRVKVEMLKKIAIDTNSNPEHRKIVVLIILVDSIITPSPDGHGIPSSYVQYLEKLDNVKDYAWGAALLAFLYIGLRKHNKGVKKIDGNLWIVFVIGFDMKEVLAHHMAPFLPHFFKNIQKLSYNHRLDDSHRVKAVF
ncbi:hypothetical protein OROGR_005559 [Orobanche gracilis]